MNRLKLSNGVSIPQLGYGTYQVASEVTISSVIHALECGYRSIDTAALYQNEKEVGQAVQRSGTARKDIFITTKVWNTDQGYRETLDAFDKSLERLDMDYVDLYLVHWPIRGTFVPTWEAVEEIYQRKQARAIGVSNFNPRHIEELLSRNHSCPMVNQVELHPYLTQSAVRTYCQQKDIVVESWAPIMKGHADKESALVKIGEAYDKTPTQVVLRWHLQHNLVAIPKSVTPTRIKENFEIFDFELSEQDMAVVDSLNANRRYGPDPETF